MDLWTSPTDRREPCGPCGQPVDNADALPTACPHSRASRPQAPQDQSPVILTRQHRTTLRRGCLHRPFRTTSASHSNPSQHRPRPSSPPILQAHFRMGLDSRRRARSMRVPAARRSRSSAGGRGSGCERDSIRSGKAPWYPDPGEHAGRGWAKVFGRCPAVGSYPGSVASLSRRLSARRSRDDW